MPDASSLMTMQQIRHIYNLQKANVTADYDSTATYEIGDYCIHFGILYRCISTILTAEDFDSSHWVSTNIDAELDGKANASDVYSKTDVYSKSQTYNKTEAVAKDDIINNQTSTATDKPLAAAQGKALKEAITQSTTTGSANHLQLPGGTYICWGSATITEGSDRVNIAFSQFAQVPIVVISANAIGTFRVNNIATYYAIIVCNEGNVTSDKTIYWAAFGTK